MITTRMKNRITALVLSLTVLAGLAWSTPPAMGATAGQIAQYNSHEKPIVDSLRASYGGTEAQALVGRAVWYMEYGFMKYGHTKYATTGYIDCSNFVSLVYRDFGYSITSAARNYGTVGTKVTGVYSRRITGSTRYTLVGVDQLRPGDIFTFWNSDRTRIGHVALYMGIVDGKPCIIGTCTGRPTAIGIVNSLSWWYGSSLKEVRRVLPSNAHLENMDLNASGPVIPAQYQIIPDRQIMLPKYLPTGF
ncbi:MAG: NlpC/P60 family protein [Syntrophomonadaceae bacterium]